MADRIVIADSTLRIEKGDITLLCADAIVNAPRDPRDNPSERIEMKVRVVEPGA